VTGIVSEIYGSMTTSLLRSVRQPYYIHLQNFGEEMTAITISLAVSL